MPTAKIVDTLGRPRIDALTGAIEAGAVIAIQRTFFGGITVSPISHNPQLSAVVQPEYATHLRGVRGWTAIPSGRPNLIGFWIKGWEEHPHQTVRRIFPEVPLEEEVWSPSSRLEKEVRLQVAREYDRTSDDAPFQKAIRAENAFYEAVSAKAEALLSQYEQVRIMFGLDDTLLFRNVRLRPALFGLDQMLHRRFGNFARFGILSARHPVSIAELVAEYAGIFEPSLLISTYVKDEAVGSNVGVEKIAALLDPNKKELAAFAMHDVDKLVALQAIFSEHPEHGLLSVDDAGFVNLFPETGPVQGVWVRPEIGVWPGNW